LNQQTEAPGIPVGLRFTPILLVLLFSMPLLAGLPGGFLFDDYPTILESESVRMAAFSLDALWQAAFAYDPAGGLPRPLVNASFGLNYWLAGADPAMFKITNIVLHAGNGLLVFALIRRLLAHVGHSDGVTKSLALVATAVWMVHPLQVSTVLYVVQRMEMACTTFTLISMLCYVEARSRMLVSGEMPRIWMAGIAAAATLAWTAKENAALIPYFLLAIEVLVFRCQAKNAATARWMRSGVIVGAVIGVAAIVALYLHGLTEPSRFAARDFGPVERLISQLVIVPHYLGLIVAPRPDAMVFYYDHWWIRPWSASEVAAGSAVLIGLATAAISLRKRRPLAALGIAWFFISHLLTSAPLPLELAFEHRNYTALAGIVLALAGLLAPKRTPIPSKAWVFSSLLILSLALVTTLRAAYWSDTSLLARYLVDINPGSARAALDLGERYMLAADKNPASPLASKAIDEFQRAMVMPNGSILGEHAAILMAAQFGMPQRQSWWDSMVVKLRDHPLRPQDVDALVGVVEQRRQGLPVDDQNLLRATLTAARRGTLAPELLFLFASHAVENAQDFDGAVELFGRGRKAITTGRWRVEDVDQGIQNIGGQVLLDAVIEWQQHAANAEATDTLNAIDP